MFGKTSAEVRYKVTVEVEDNGVLRKGSSVWSWRLGEPLLALGSPYSGKFKGEAVAVDLANGPTLFAILKDADGGEGSMMMIPERLFGDIAREKRGEPRRFAWDRVRDLRDIASRIGERQVLDGTAPARVRPMLVVFRDITRPETVERVDPCASEAILGPGVKFRQFVIEITDEPVTTGIEKRLPWLPSHAGAFLKRPDGVAIGDMPLAGRLNEGDFWRGPET
jgi:hypothetical protein